MKPRPWLRIITRITIAAVFVALLTLLHFSFAPFLKLSWPIQALNQNPSTAILTTEHAASVLYRNAPWKGHIGRWLSDCDAFSKGIVITETIHSTKCKNNCRGRGICNYEFGRCNCYHGYTGESCEVQQNLECNDPPVEGWPYGGWRVSICSAQCDTRTARCFCGDGSMYPERPVGEYCGFLVRGTEVDWSKNDFTTLYANASQKVGWCNIDPVDYYNGKIKTKELCHCKYDCTAGTLCEKPTECVCINQCSGNGFCSGGFCQCNAGWFGIDCSIPSVTAQPSWVQNSAQIRWVNKSMGIGGDLQSLSMQKKRPLIYVYDLPPEYNSHLLEGRHFKFLCVNRVYDERNATLWSDQLYGAEVALYESLLSSPHRTTNGDEADFFYVPVLGACAIARADHAPHLSIRNYLGRRVYFSGDMYKRAYKFITKSYPFWNQSEGRNHIWFFPWDEGACAAPKEIWNSIMLTHWGNTNSKHNYSTTGYLPDNWDPIPKEWRGSHPCYDPEKDIVLPAWKVPNPSLISERLWARHQQDRKTLFYFNGNLGNAYENGRLQNEYSMGIRQKLAYEFGSSPNKEGKLGRQAQTGVIVTNKRSPNYGLDLSSSQFCGVLPGDGWSGRMEDSILHGCIPVIIQDGIYLPYEGFLDYGSFAVRIAENDLPQMVSILRNFTEEEVGAKLAAVQGLWQRFTYRDAIMLEARRQKEQWNHRPEWAIQYETLEGDDVLATLIQILHYKLHIGRWQATQGSTGKEFGIPKSCSAQL